MSPTILLPFLRFFDALSWVSCATLRLSHGKTREVSAPSFPSANEHHDASTVRITPVKVWFFFSGRNRSGNRFGWLSAVNQHLLLSSFKRFQMYRFVDVYVCVCVFCFKDLFKIKLFWVHCNHEVPVFNICITSMTLVPLNTRTGILLHGRSKWLARPQGH